MNDEPQQKPKAATFNNVMLNIGAVPNDAPDPSIAPILIDGTPLQSVIGFCIKGGVDELTTVTLQFHANVTGMINGSNVGDMLKQGTQH